MSNVKIECAEARILITGLVDEEITDKQKQDLFAHLESCKVCQATYESFVQLKKETSEMKFNKLPEVYWDEYWTHVYNRIERGLSWIFVSIGLIILLGYGSYQVMQDFYLNPDEPILIKMGVGLLTAGMIILFISVLREKLMIRKVDKYRSVER